MNWSIGYDSDWNRDIGYGVPSICDHPDCDQRINRGLSYVCGGEPYGGEGCGLFFCQRHLNGGTFCERCRRTLEPFNAKPDVIEWVRHKLTDESWDHWRRSNPEEVERLTTRLPAQP